jgi:hypothetical protein
MRGEFARWGDRMNLGSWMSAVLMFTAISAIGGLVLGFYCVSWRVIVIPNLIIAIVSVIGSLYQDFSFLGGVAFVFGCLSLNQIAYVIGAVIIVFSEHPKASLTGDQADDYPGESQRHNVKGKNAPPARWADHKSGYH